jgi:outer membrane protein assembly factor BamB
MMPVRRVCLVILACAIAVGGLTGCSAPVMVCGCPAVTKAYALEVTMAGSVRWRVRLGLPPSGPQPSPLAVGAVAVFAQSDVLIPRRAGEFAGSELYGLRLADGHRLWSRTFGQGIASMWRWQDLVVVLTQIGRSARPLPVLIALVAATGRTRWTLPVGGDVDASSPTADGGLAAVVDQDSVLEMVDLSSGRIRWARRIDGTEFPPVAAAGGAVLFASPNGELTSYDDQTGRVRWTVALNWISLNPTSVQRSGLVYLTGEVQQDTSAQPTQMVLGISAADGRVKWRFTHGPSGSLDPSAPGVVSVSGYSGRTSQDELDPATGRIRWQVVSRYPAVATPAGIVTAPGPDRIRMRDPLTGHVRWTARLRGGWLATGPSYPDLPVFPAGRLLVVPANGPNGPELVAFRMSDGYRRWQVATPPIAAPPSAVRGGILVYTV